MSDDRTGPAIWAGVVFLGTLGLCLWQLAPGVFWLDSSEFISCARGASVPHPPGTPGYILLAQVATLLPVGSVAFRINLLSALLGAGAAVALFGAGRQLVLRVQRPGFISDGAIALTVLALSLSRAAWFQGIRSEVYTLNYLVTALAVYLALRWDEAPGVRGGIIPLVALLLGFGLTNHHYLVLLTLPAFVVFLLTRPEGRGWLAPRRLVPLLGFAAAGLLVYVFLPLRSDAGAYLAWGDATRPGGFFGMVSAQAFHLSVTEMPRAPFLEACTTIIESWIDLMGPALFFAGILGLVAWVWRSPRIGGFLALLVAAGLFSKAIMYLDVENPDDHGYFFAGLQALTLATTGLLPALESLARRLVRGSAPWVAATLVALIGAGALATNAAAFDADRRIHGLRDFNGPDAINRAFFEELPPDATFLPSYYATFFNHVYFRSVEQRRPDIAIVHQSFFRRIEGGVPYRDRIRDRHPDLGPVVDAHHTTGFFPLESLLEVSKQRPVILEVDVLELDADDPAWEAVSLGKGGLDLPWEHVRFMGPGIRLNTRAVTPFDRQSLNVLTRFWQRFYRGLSGERLHPELKKILLWIHYRNALYFGRSGQWDEAGLEAGLALRHAPDQARLLSLQALAEDRRQPLPSPTECK